MSFDIKPATPDHVPIILGITSPSGAGKTLSSLLLAHGIQEVVGGDIGMIDTEGRRGLRYADKARWPDLNFKHLDFQPPFSSDRYGEAIAAMAKTQGMKTIIVDSMSHEHEGPGGYLEFHDRELDRMVPEKNDYKKREKMTFTAWIKPAAARRRLINSFLQTPLNFIFCFRAKEKIKPVRGGEPILLGWQAIAGEEFVYEMIVRALLLPGAKGVPDWSESAFKHGAAKLDAQDAALFPDDKPLSREVGRNIAQVYAGAGPVRSRMDAGTAETRRSKQQVVEDIKAELKEACEGGLAPLMAVWDRLTADQQRYLSTYYDNELIHLARAADIETEQSAETSDTEAPI